MNNLLKAEQAMQFTLCILALYYQPIELSWWLWGVLFFLPDLSMIGYAINTRVGAVCYNIAHHKGIAGIFILAGVVYSLPMSLLGGLILWGHSSFDRALGYGLKFPDSFQRTHLGVIGKNG